MFALVRKVMYNSKEIMLQRRFLVFWRNWKLLHNDLYAKDNEIVECVDKLKKLLNERLEIVAWLKSEEKEIGDAKRYRMGSSEPFKYKIGWRDYFFKRYLDLSPVEGTWRAAISPSLLGEKKKAAGLRGEMGIPDHKSSGTTAYVPEQLDSWKISLKAGDDFDDVLSFKEPRSQGSGNNKGGNNPRNRRKGESDHDYQERMRQLGSGDDFSY